jgi:hypothetical protein
MRRRSWRVRGEQQREATMAKKSEKDKKKSKK